MGMLHMLLILNPSRVEQFEGKTLPLFCLLQHLQFQSYRNSRKTKTPILHYMYYAKYGSRFL